MSITDICVGAYSKTWTFYYEGISNLFWKDKGISLVYLLQCLYLQQTGRQDWSRTDLF